MKEQDILDKVPSNETIWVQYRFDGNITHLITSNRQRDTYYIYEVRGTSLNKLGKGRDPQVLEEKYLHIRSDI